ncbi:hypothetical protein ACHAWF_001870 [Thalassiosira exigua]
MPGEGASAAAPPPSSSSSSWRLWPSHAGSDFSLKSAACPPGEDLGRLKPLRVVDEERAAGSRSRTFYAYFPPKLCDADGRLDGPLRIILAVHGYTGRPRQELTKWRSAAVALDAVILAPEGTGEKLGWNAVHCCGDPVDEGIDDVDFVLNGAVGVFLREMNERRNEKSENDSGHENASMIANVIATGFSNGGFLSSLLGLQKAEARPPWLAGVVPAGGYQYDEDLYLGSTDEISSGSSSASSRPPRPLPVSMHHGGKDSVVKPEGCCARAGEEPSKSSLKSNCPADIGAKRTECTSVHKAFEMWTAINRCSSVEEEEGGPPKDEDQRREESKRGGKDPKDRMGPAVTCWEGKDCASPTEFCLWHDEGHSWGNRFPGIERVTAWTEDVFRAAEEEGRRNVDSEGSRAPSGFDRGRRGRSDFSLAFLMMCTLLAAYAWRRHRSGVGTRKRKSSEEEGDGCQGIEEEGEEEGVALVRPPALSAT